MDGNFMDLDLVERAIISVDWFPFHEVECLKPIDYLNFDRLYLGKSSVLLIEL